MARDNFIGGAWKAARGAARPTWCSSRRPAPALAEVASSDAADVNDAVAAAAAAFESGRTRPRASVSRCSARSPTRSRPTCRRLQDLEVRNVGKPLSIVDFEMDLTVDNWRFFAAGARFLEGRAGRRVHRGPHVVPPPRPARGGRLDRALELPAQHGDVEGRARARGRQHRGAQAVGADAAERAAPGGDHRRHPAAGRAQRRDRRRRARGRVLVSHPDVAMVSLTGDVATGQAIARAAADSLKRVHLELGGKAPVIVFDDADIEAVVADADRDRLLQLGPGLHRAVPCDRGTQGVRRRRERTHRVGRRRSRPATRSPPTPRWGRSCRPRSSIA